MRLSTLVVASAFTWVFTAGMSWADEGDSAATEPDAVEQAAPEASAAEEAPPVAWDQEAAEAVPVAPEAAAVADVVPEATEAVPTAPSESASWDDFEDPGFDPTAPVDPTPEPVSQPAASSSLPLGPMAVDENGVEGRIHTVAKGDTLWDISEAYLGTPWVWPSVWNENGSIENPHLIEPGDRIWITSNEMRPVTDEEAEEMIAAGETEVAAEIDPLPEDEPAMEFEQDQTLMAEEPLPASVEDESGLPVAMLTDPADAMTGEIITLPSERTANFATPQTMEESSEIVDSPTLRAFLTQRDEVYIPLGEGEVSKGDQYTIFREIEKIRDVETGAVLGYHFDERGWLEIVSVGGEASTAIIQGANADMQRGDRIVPRVERPRDIPVRMASTDIEGSIVFMPGNRWLMGSTDSVYLNVGSIHGVEVGTQMEVYHTGIVKDSNKMPDTVEASLVVISVEPEACVAFVTQTIRELEIGDHVRTVVNEQLVSR